MPRDFAILGSALTLASVVATGAAHGSEAVDRALEKLVRQDCGSCHGMSLKGGLGPALRGERLRRLPAEAISQIILDGVPGSAMPPWRSLLAEDEALWIANYLLREADR